MPGNGCHIHCDEVQGGFLLQTRLRQVTLGVGGQLRPRQAGDLRGLLQPFTIFVIAAMLVLLTTAARTWVVAADPRNRPLHRAAGISSLERLFRQYGQERPTRPVDRLLSDFARSGDDFLPFGVGARWIVLPDETLQH